jgi:hypothetical protein
MRLTWIGGRLINLDMVVEIVATEAAGPSRWRDDSGDHESVGIDRGLVVHLAGVRPLTLRGEDIETFLALIGGPTFPSMVGEEVRLFADDDSGTGEFIQREQGG